MKRFQLSILNSPLKNNRRWPFAAILSSLDEEYQLSIHLAHAI